jgi:hypothetical protein
MPARKSQHTARPGFVNRNGQVVVRNTRQAGTDHLQYVYQMGCSACGHVYGTNGAEVYERRCPKCGGGIPGLPVTSCCGHGHGGKKGGSTDRRTCCGLFEDE